MYSIKNYLDITVVLIAKDFKIKYKNTLFGYVWAVGHPLVFAVILYIAFKHIIRIKVDNYGLFLIVGIFPWIIKKIMFPKSLLPLSTVLIEMVHFAISWIVIIVFLFINDHHLFYFSWLYGIPLITAIQLVLIFGIGLAVSSLNIFFRDTERIVSIMITMLFYLTPVIFPLNMVPEAFKPYFLLNPMTGIVELWRALFIEGFVLWRWLGISAVYATLSLLGGSVLYQRLKGRFAEVL